MHILVVDDDKSIIELLNLVLPIHGHSVISRSSSKEAIEAFMAEPFGMVLSDINMPEMDGNELVRFIKATSSQNLPVVAITGNVEMASPLFDQVISKPIYTKELIEAINTFGEPLRQAC